MNRGNPGHSKRKGDEQHLDLLTSKNKKGNNGRPKPVEGSLPSDTHMDTENKIWCELLQNMNSTLEVIRNDQISAAHRIGRVDGELRSTIDVVENRLRRLESFVDRQGVFNDRQHDYNDRIATVLEILVGRKGKKTALETEFRDGKEGAAGDGDGSDDANTELKRRAPTSEEHQPSPNLIHPESPNLAVMQSPPTISLNGNDCACRDFDISFHYSDSLIYMDGWAPTKLNTSRPPSAHQTSPSAGRGYDPFGPIPKRVFQRVLDLIERERGLNISEFTSASEFYLQMLLDKPRWEGDQYGWLTDEHMGRGMDLFRKRSMAEPSPYKTERIAFLDPMLCALWCQQRSEYEKNPSPDRLNYFLELFTGQTPAYCATNKVWYRDVDILYVAHFTSASHWIAVEINLIDHTMYIYDSAVDAVSDRLLVNSVRAYETLIAGLVKVMGPKKNQIIVKPFAVIKSKRTPLNYKCGDCGIYTLKCIECLALGMRFTGLEDKNILFIRRKYAVDIMTEVLHGSTRQSSQPNPRFGVDQEK